MIEGRPPRRWRTRLAIVIVAVGMVAGNASVAPGVTAATAPAKAAPPTAATIGKYAVGVMSKTFVDTTRPTDANGRAPALPTRTLLTAIYYPAEGKPNDKPIGNATINKGRGPYPLILFTHGLYARGVFYEDVLKAWVSAGYVVAAPDYPLSNKNTPGAVNFGTGVADTKNQPADASFVINQVIKDKQLGGIVDPKRIGASGHSLGGITTYGLAYSACCRDRRVKAAIPMSGFGGLIEPIDQYFRNGPTPLLALHGNTDGTVPIAGDINTFARAQPPKFFLTFIGAGHIQPFLGGTDAQATALKQSTVDFWDRYLKGDKAALDELRAHANVPGSSKLEEQTVSPVSGRTPRPARREAARAADARLIRFRNPNRFDGGVPSRALGAQSCSTARRRSPRPGST
jgi:dienelactone hydrolase